MMRRMNAACLLLDAFERKILHGIQRELAALVSTLGTVKDLNAARAMARVGEAIARRLIFAMALGLPARAPIAPRAMPTRIRKALHAAPRPDASSASATPRFRLSEPLRFAGYFDPPRAKGRPRIRSFDDIVHAPDPSPRPVVPPDAALIARQRLDRRIAALAGVVEDPLANARRLLVWRARQAGRRRAGRPGRLSPLRPGRPRCLKRFNGLDPVRPPPSREQGALWEADQLVLRLIAGSFPNGAAAHASSCGIDARAGPAYPISHPHARDRAP